MSLGILVLGINSAPQGIHHLVKKGCYALVLLLVRLGPHVYLMLQIVLQTGKLQHAVDAHHDDLHAQRLDQVLGRPLGDALQHGFMGMLIHHDSHRNIHKGLASFQLPQCLMVILGSIADIHQNHIRQDSPMKICKHLLTIIYRIYLELVPKSLLDAPLAAQVRIHHQNLQPLNLVAAPPVPQ